ncbi:class I SAM-dependent methyltransferase [Streptosporangium fragile]|uniref:Class I SAM-dependent methyltransferase n=1 Tax=Streptosporangium fragile TaxID=46186 RepID=A0ABP6ILZ1_9ACTN
MKPADVGTVFDSTDAEFAELGPVLWNPIGAATVAAARIHPGERVLDACCGAGSSAIPAAAAAGPEGRVDAVDLAGSLLEHGRRRAAAAGIGNLVFTRADVTSWAPAGNEPYDLVQCVHGVFFLPDMDAAVSRLIGLLRPGGRLVVTTWARGAMEDFGRAFSTAVEKVRGTPGQAPNNRDSVTRIDSEESLGGWMTGLGLERVTVTRSPLSLPLDDSLAWTLILGSGFRGLLNGLDDTAVERVRTILSGLLRERGLRTLDATSLIGVGVRPAE